jgi:Ca2+/Na+ antiporter
MKPNYALATSSLLLLFPAWAAWKSGDTVRVWYHSGVTVVSVTYHLTKHPVIFWVDVVLANSLVPSALPLVIQRDYVMVTYVCCVAYCMTMFYYGYMKKDLVWHPDPAVATPYHVSLHLAASFGLVMGILITNSSLTLERSRTPMSRLEVADAP